MSRLPEIDPAKLHQEQRAIYDRMMRERGHMRGPFAVWLRNAELCDSTLKLQEMFASRVKLERRLLELMSLVAARQATAQYAGFIHEPDALKFVKKTTKRAPRKSPAKPNARSTISRWHSIRRGRFQRIPSKAAWRCSASKQWSSWSALSVSTRWLR